MQWITASSLYIQSIHNMCLARSGNISESEFQIVRTCTIPANDTRKPMKLAKLKTNEGHMLKQIKVIPRANKISRDQIPIKEAESPSPSPSSAPILGTGPPSLLLDVAPPPSTSCIAFSPKKFSRICPTGTENLCLFQLPCMWPPD